MSDEPRYVVIEGPIGVGKTSLARRLSRDLGSDLLLEAPEDNPFLGRFYRDPRGSALATQLFFLLQRVRQMEAVYQGDLFRPALIADFLIEKDRLFAEATLDAEELTLYEQVHAQLTVAAPEPDLVIYLQAPVEVLRKRIAGRGRDYERGIDAGYLHGICDAYARFFYDYDRAPLLIVNAAEIDLVSGDADYAALLTRIEAIRGGRHYFNPLPLGEALR